MNPEAAVRMILERAAEIIGEEILQSLARLGEESVTRIRRRSMEESWIDHTGNLRSSIGYAVFDYGLKVIGSSFESVAGPEGSGREGSLAGEEYIRSLASRFSDTYALVVVAGMEYAEYVEAVKGKDVLASTEVWAKSRINRYLEDAKARAEARINEIINTV